MFKNPYLDRDVPLPSEYLLGMVFGLVLVWVELFLAAVLFGDAPPESIASFALLTGLYGGLSVLVVGAPLVVVTHFLVRRTTSQVIQVAAFTVTGGLTALIPGLLLGVGSGGAAIYGAAAVAGSASRALLIPIVRSRADRAHRGHRVAMSA